MPHVPDNFQWTHDPGGTVYLSDTHYRTLSIESGIADDVISGRRYQTIPRNAEGIRLLADLKVTKRFREPKTQRLPGLLIPLYRPTGEQRSWQFRPLLPVPDRRREGRQHKYTSPRGIPPVVDVHPCNVDRVADPSIELWITEGTKKADSLASRGVCALALSGVWNWRKPLGELGDWEAVPLRGRRVVVCFDSDAATNTQIANAMKRLGAWLRSKGAKAVAYLVVPEREGVTGKTGVDDFLVGGGALDELRAAMATEAPRPLDTGDTFTDARLAETLAEDVLDGRFRWAAGLGWLGWDGRRWHPVPDQEPLDAIRTHVLEQFNTAVRASDRGAADGWYKLTSLSRMRAVLGLASGVDGVLTDIADLDGDPDLLNATNGVVDLVTGQLRPHDPDLLMTKLAGCAYEAGATHPDWSAALQAVPDDVRPWLQERFGQAVTGHMTPDDKLVIQQGSGENGKTTITTGVTRALRDYFLLVSDRVLLADPKAHPTELMDLRGVRFALIEETPEARRMNVQRLKKVVGTPQITARYIMKDSVTFDAMHSLFVSSNYRPIVEETDHGTWRRLALVVFPYRFVAPPGVPENEHDRRGDPGLRERLKFGLDGQHEAVLAWLVEGATRWYRQKRVMAPAPITVETDTHEWRKDSDVVLSYIDERLVFDARTFVMSSELLDDVNEWLRRHGQHEWSAKLLASRLGGHAEVTRQRVTQDRRRRTDEGLSRRPRSSVFEPVSAPVPARFRAWLGVRFRTADDDEREEMRPGTFGRSDNEKSDSRDGWDRTSEPFLNSIAREKGSKHLSHPSQGAKWAVCARCGHRRFGDDGCPRCD